MIDNLIPKVAEVLNSQDGNWKDVYGKGFNSSYIGFAGSVQNRLVITSKLGINYFDATQVYNTGKLRIDCSSLQKRIILILQ